MDKPRVSYDREADALYVKLTDAPFAREQSIDDARHLNLAADGQVIGLEVLGVSRGVDLEGVPHADTIRRALRRRGIPVRKAEDRARSPAAQAVAAVVVAQRARRGLSQAALGKQLGMTPPQVARLELADHDPSIGTLRRLARALGVTFNIEVAPDGHVAVKVGD